MERVTQIGIYEYINECFPSPKENKVYYFKILMKRPQFLHAHMEWLYNNPNVFLGQFMMLDGANEEYTKAKYDTSCGIARQHTGTYSPAEHIEGCGLYAYVETYGGMSTGNKLETYYAGILNPILFESHCKALLQKPYHERFICKIFPLYDITSAFT